MIADFCFFLQAFLPYALMALVAIGAWKTRPGKVGARTDTERRRVIISLGATVIRGALK